MHDLDAEQTVFKFNDTNAAHMFLQWIGSYKLRNKLIYVNINQFL
jgi:hypothetical protein